MGGFRPKPLTEAAIEWLGKWGIDRATALAAGLGFMSQIANLQGARDGERHDVICFPYIAPGGQTVNWRLRSIVGYQLWQADGETILYNLDRLDRTQPQIVFAPDEMTVLAMVSAGIENVVCMPNYDAAFASVYAAREDLMAVPKIVLALGHSSWTGEVEAELTRRLGNDRVWIAPHSDGGLLRLAATQGPDALRAVIAAAKPLPIDNLHRIEDYAAGVAEAYHHGVDRGLKTGLTSLDECYRIVAGHLTLVTGVPGGGKSELMDQIAVNMMRLHEWKFAIASFENPPADDHIPKLIEKFVGAPFWPGPTQRMDEREVTRAQAWLNDRVFLIQRGNQMPTIDFILDRARMAVLRHGIKGLIIDPYNRIDRTRGEQREDEFIATMLGKVDIFRRAHGVHVWFVAHPRTMRREGGKVPKVTAYDVSGGGQWFNIADNILIVSRDKTDIRLVTSAEVTVEKIRSKWIGREGVVNLLHNRATGCYSDVNEQRAPVVTRSQFGSDG